MTEDLAKIVYKKVNTGKAIDTSVIQREKLVGTEIENAYQKAILSNVGKKGKDPTQMKDQSILSDHVKYVKHDGSGTFHNLYVDTLNYC